jgi:hypothetical protein
MSVSLVLRLMDAVRMKTASLWPFWGPKTRFL